MSRFLPAAVAAVAVMITAPATAQEAEGYWSGKLDFSGTELTVGIDIARAADGSLSGTADSPDQGNFDIPLANVAVEDDIFAFAVPAVGASFSGTWDAASRSWIGSFTQGGQARPLTLTAGERPERPQAAERPRAPADWSVPDNEAIGAIIAERLALRPGTGMVVGVLTPDGVRYVSNGPGEGAPFDADTLFEIGSITKVFAALLLADMVLDGTVSLDDAVANYLPDGASMPTRDGQQVTLKHLARHESGLPRLPDNMSPSDIRDPYAEYDEAALLEYLSGYELTRDIGSEYDYSNLGFGLLGYALARAGGADFETLLRQRILGPLEMTDTAITLSEDQQVRFATPRDEFNRETLAWSMNALSAAGSLRSNATDMLKFAHAAMDPQSPIAPAMQLALSDLRDAPGFRTGLGWMVVNAPSGMIAMHGGGTGGFRAHVAVQEDSGQGVVVLTNSAIEPSAQDIALHLLAGAPLSEAQPVPGAPAELDRTEVDLTTAQLDRVVGTYRFAPGLDMVIAREGDQLMAAITGQGALPIFPRSPTEFFWRAVDAEILFTEDGVMISGASFSQDGMTSVLVRVD
ncbi:MAG: serine hydrolase [Alteraurantiacibacter sp.]